MKHRSRLAILAAALLLGGASVAVVGYAASVPVHPSPATSPAPKDQTGEQQDANDGADTTENKSGGQAEDAADSAEQDPAGAQVGHQDAPGTPGQSGENED